jgi:preprotein translocase subunit SecE
MDKVNQKILTMSFLIFSALISVSLSLLMKAFAGSFGFVARLHDLDIIKHGLPVLVGIGLFVYLQFNSKVLAWGDEVVVEIKKVVWPSKKDTTGMTVVVIVMVMISSLIISAFDFLSGYIINYFIR